MLLKRSSAVLLSTILFCCAASAADRRGFAPEDLYRLQSVADPQLSPDGKMVAYTVTQADKAKNRRLSSVWLVPVDGSAAPRKLTGAQSARNPRWSPDGKLIAYIASAAETPQNTAVKPDPNPPNSQGANTRAQVYTMPVAGGEATRVTNFKDGASRAEWSPDGSQLACVVKTAVPDKPAATDVKHYKTIFYKQDGSGWSDNKRNHIWVVSSKGGEPRQVSTGEYREDNDPQWSPDGKSIAFSSTDMGPELRQTLEMSDVFIVSTDGGNARPLSDKRTFAQNPRWSPDGRWIAFAAAPSSDEQPQLRVIPVAGGTSKLATDMDLFPTSINWTADGHIYFTALDRGAQLVYRSDPATQKTESVVLGKRSVVSPDLNDAQRKLVYVASDSQHPSELFVADLNGRDEKQLTHHNDDYLAQVTTQATQDFTWKSVDDWSIQGFLIKPVGWQAGRKYPMVLNIHGGPNGMWGYQWCSDCQLYAAQGWGVLMINPRGSSGYGMNFQRGVAGEWGGKAYQDLMNGIQATLSANPWIDKDRLGVTGVSYGGFMTDWIVTQTDIFKAAVPIAGISDLISIEGIRDGAYGHSRDFGGDLWQAFDNYWKYSAVRLASKVTTPMLFLHGEADHRVPPSQAEEYFRALKHFGKTAEIVLFPREPHSPGNYEPKHQVESLEWRVYWFDRYLNANTQAVAPDERRAAQAQASGESK